MAKENHGERLTRSAAHRRNRRGDLVLTRNCLRWETQGYLFWRDNVPSVHVHLRYVERLQLQVDRFRNWLIAEFETGERLQFLLDAGPPVLESRELEHANTWLQGVVEDAHLKGPAATTVACAALEAAIKAKKPQPVWHWLLALIVFFISIYAGTNLVDEYGPLSKELLAFVAGLLCIRLVGEIGSRWMKGRLRRRAQIPASLGV